MITLLYNTFWLKRKFKKMSKEHKNSMEKKSWTKTHENIFKYFFFGIWVCIKAQALLVHCSMNWNINNIISSMNWCYYFICMVFMNFNFHLNISIISWALFHELKHTKTLLIPWIDYDAHIILNIIRGNLVLCNHIICDYMQLTIICKCVFSL